MLIVCACEEQGKVEEYAVPLNRVFLKVGKINRSLITLQMLMGNTASLQA